MGTFGKITLANKISRYFLFKGENTQSQGDCLNRVHSDQMVLGTVRREAEPFDRRTKSLKAKLAQGGQQAQVHTDQMALDGQVGGWTTLMVVKGARGNSSKSTIGSQGT